MMHLQNHLRKGQTIILESTTYPGTTEEIILSKLKKFNIGKDFFVAEIANRLEFILLLIMMIDAALFKLTVEVRTVFICGLFILFVLFYLSFFGFLGIRIWRYMAEKTLQHIE